MVREDEVKSTVEGPMSEIEIHHCVDRYYKLTMSILPVGDLTQRKLTFGDFLETSAARDMAEKGELDGAVERLMAILEDSGGRKHTLLGKVCSVIALNDIALLSSNFWTESRVEKVKAALAETAHNYSEGVPILLGALYARFMAAKLDSPADIGQISNLIDKETPDQRLACAIKGARNAVMEMLREETLRMKLPVSVLYINTPGPQEGAYASLDEVGYPHTILHLGLTADGRNKIPRPKKMAEAIVLGVPNDETHILDVRPLHSLMGIETDITTPVSADSRERAITVKQLHHIYLPGYTSDGYCSLAYWGAVAAIRLLNKDSFRELPNELRAKKGKAVVRKVVNFLNQEFRGKSILSRAIEEHEKLTGEKISVEDAENKLFLAIASLAVDKDPKSGILYTRDERVLTGKFISYIWNQRLEEQDRLTFIKLSLSDPKSPIWQRIDDQKLRVRIRESIRPGGIGEADNYLLQLVDLNPALLHRFFIMRVETIRDKKGPNIFWDGLQIPDDDFS